MRNTSFGLMRFVGMLGFLAVGVGSFYKGNQWFDLNIDMSTMGVSELGGKGIGLMLAACFVGMLGLIVGQGLGASIPVRDDRISSAIDILWHYGPNTCIIWSMVSMGLLGISLGKAGSKEFVLSMGIWRFLLLLTTICTVMGWAIAFELHVIADGLLKTGQVEKGRVLGNLLPMLTGLAVGVLQSMLWGANVFLGAIAGLMAPFAIIPLSMHLKEKDYERRIKAKVAAA